MSDWRVDNIHVDTLRRDDYTVYVVEIDGERHLLSEREADALKGELSVYGAKNPNRGGRYHRKERSDMK